MLKFQAEIADMLIFDRNYCCSPQGVDNLFTIQTILTSEHD